MSEKVEVDREPEKVINVQHVIDHAEKIKRKAMWKLEQQIAGPLNQMFVFPIW